MIRTATIAAAIVLCTAAPPGLAQFEGTVESENLSSEGFGGAERFSMRMHIRPDRVRIDTDGGRGDGMTIIYRGDRSVVWLVNLRDSSYQELPHASRSGAARDAQPGGSGFTVRKTGASKHLLGFRCQQVLLLRGEEVTEIWGAPALGDISATLSRVIGGDGGAGGGWQEELRSLKMFPLSAKITIGGRVVESQTVTRIRREKVRPALFELPPRLRREAPVALPEEGRE